MSEIRLNVRMSICHNVYEFFVCLHIIVMLLRHFKTGVMTNGSMLPSNLSYTARFLHSPGKVVATILLLQVVGSTCFDRTNVVLYGIGKVFLLLQSLLYVRRCIKC